MHTAAPRDNPGSAVITAGRADDFMWKSNHGISGTFCFFPGEMMFLGKETEPVPEAEPNPPPHCETMCQHLHFTVFTNEVSFISRYGDVAKFGSRGS